MIVYGANVSPFVRKVLVAVEAKGLNYDHEMVLPGTQTPEYLAISPLGKIPALRDGEFAVCDSTVICEYLDEQYQDVVLRPQQAEQRARCRWFEEYGDTKLAEVCSGLFFERLVKPAMMQQATDEQRVNTILNKHLPEQMQYLEAQLPETGWMFDQFSIADIALTTHFINAEYAGQSVDATQWPNTASYLQRVKQHPPMANVLSREADTLAMLTSALEAQASA